jgi:hypothetical protein
MANAIPPGLRRIIAEQAGVISRRQVLRAGVSRNGWAAVASAPCDTAGQVYRALRTRGYLGNIRPCSATCRALLAA